jgi:transposase
MMKRHEVQILRRAGHSREDVAARTGVSVPTIRRIDDEAPVAHVDTARARKERRVGRPRQIETWRAFIEAILAKEPELLTLELLRRARIAGYARSKSPFYALVSGLRPLAPSRPLVRFEGLPGEFSQHDFGEVDVRFVDGTVRRVHFFASRLKWSRWVQVSLVVDQRVESLVRSLVDHFDAMGGVPLVAVFDRPKTVAIKWAKDGTVTEWNSTFTDVTVQLGVGVEACWPYRAQEKGAVENLVGWVKGSFFKQRRFIDDEDLRQQLAEWLVIANTQTVSRATGVTPAARIDEERARLRPLRVRPDELMLRVPVHVGPTAMVLHETNLYSMPPEAIGLPATLYLGRDRVRIVAARFCADHGRLFGRGGRSMLSEHRAAHVAAVSGKRGRRYLKREQILALGPAANAYLTEIVHRRHARWIDDVERLYDLLEDHGEHVVRAAIEEALSRRVYGAEYVAALIDEQAAVATQLLLQTGGAQ